MKLLISLLIMLLTVGYILFEGKVTACVSCSGMIYNPAFTTCCMAGPPDTVLPGGDVCCPGSSGTRQCDGDYIFNAPSTCAY
jgi:hypothetical protein